MDGIHDKEPVVNRRIAHKGYDGQWSTKMMLIYKLRYPNWTELICTIWTQSPHILYGMSWIIKVLEKKDLTFAKGKFRLVKL